MQQGQCCGDDGAKKDKEMCCGNGCCEANEPARVEETQTCAVATDESCACCHDEKTDS